MDKFMIFDTHAHYDDEAFDSDRDLLLDSLGGAGIRAVTNIGASLASCRTTLELVERYPWMYGAVGVHPSETMELEMESPHRCAQGREAAGIRWLRAAAAGERIVAIGEIGLDYYWEEPDHVIQKKWFIRQLELARELKLPVVIHSRDAAKDTLDIMKGEHARDLGGVIHCFSYSKETAREYLDMGYYLGIGGVITFNNAKKLKEVVEYMPLESIVLETDCPYLAPVPNRGKRNSSLNLPKVVELIAALKHVPEEQVEAVTWENAVKMYRITNL